MQLFIDDAGFVRAPIELVYDRITHIAAWPTWWHGAQVRPAPAVGDGEAWFLALRGARARRVRLHLVPVTWRLHAGFTSELRGDLDGTWEIWLERSRGGTVIHHVVLATSPSPHPGRVQADVRRALRRGLWGCKDALQLEARTSAGLLP